MFIRAHFQSDWKYTIKKCWTTFAVQKISEDKKWTEKSKKDIQGQNIEQLNSLFLSKV